MDALRIHGLNGEVIISDNGSTDGSQEIALRKGARVINATKRGYGFALQTGIEQSKGRYVLMGDADCSYDFGHVDRFVKKLDEGCDLVMGNRFRGGIKPGAMPWKNHYIGNPALSLVGRILFGSPAGDFHCGLRAFRRDAYDKMDLRTGGMEFASEMVIRATMLKLCIGEIPTTLSPDGRNRPPHLRPWRDGWRHLRFMLLFSPKWLFLIPGLLLIATGSILGGLLLPGALHLGRIVLDVHTLLFCAFAIIIGTQSVFFSIMTKFYAVQNGLMPGDNTFERIVRTISLEKGLLTGITIFIFGLGISLASVFQWSSHSFGMLSPAETLRLVIPGGLLLMLGCQISLNSCFIGILGLRISK
jgi:glycosyltransferase involved in cell wall biosynthesis